MKYIVSFIIVIVLFFTVFPSALAHVLQTDGVIGAVLHIDPNDDPVANEESRLFFELKDRSGKYTPADCHCIVTVTKNGEEVLSNEVSADEQGVAFSYIFPEKNIYTITLLGESMSGKFEQFTISYDIRVEREKVSGSVNTHNNRFAFHIIHFVAVVVGIGIALVITLKNKYKKR